MKVKFHPGRGIEGENINAIAKKAADDLEKRESLAIVYGPIEIVLTASEVHQRASEIISRSGEIVTFVASNDAEAALRDILGKEFNTFVAWRREGIRSALFGVLEKMGLESDKIERYLDLIDPTTDDFLEEGETFKWPNGIPIVDVQDGVQQAYRQIIRVLNPEEVEEMRNKLGWATDEKSKTETYYFIGPWESSPDARKRKGEQYKDITFGNCHKWPEAEVAPSIRLVPPYGGGYTAELYQKRMNRLEK